MLSYQGKNVVIIGLGISGLSCVNYFLSKNIVPKVIDTRIQPSGLDQLDPRIETHTGSFCLDWILNADLLVVSPGIALFTPEIVKASQKGIEIVGDIELFCREINAQKNKKIIAITGANGKTTVTTLVGKIIADAGIKVGVGGNIGKPALSLLQDDCDVYVLELSSFQLETTQSLQAYAATILNISEDHTDRYPNGLMQYVAAKQSIYSNAKNCIINSDDKLTYPQVKNDNQQIITFGLHNAKYHLDTDYHYLMIDNENLLNTNHMQLLGVHNYLNVLSALAMTDVLGIDRQVSLKTIASFKGLPHRFELVYKNKGVSWINDSKATNVGSTEAALNSVVCHGTLFLLLGGDGKSADFAPLISYLKRPHIKIFCFGKDKSALSKLRPEVTTIIDTMEQAMQQIAKQVKAEDVVLLSPACASYDQFKNYNHRGEVFAQLAKELG
ncbi:UDP-N-acetylmuramoyl-L-alanine--D-glutamate ligase [Orbaceae bacterium ac157xtp]